MRDMTHVFLKLKTGISMLKPMGEESNIEEELEQICQKQKHQQPPSSAKHPSVLTATNVQFPQKPRPKTQPPLNKEKPAPGNPSPTLRKPPAKRPVISMPPTREVYNPLGILKEEVATAVRDHKTFTIKGQFPAVRRALLKRGWVEKYHPSYRYVTPKAVVGV